MSTSTALTIVGAAAGFAMGGPAGAQWGAMIGGTIGGMMTANATHMRGPRLSDLSVQKSEEGAPIPVLFGAVRVAGNVLQCSEKRERAHKTSAGKGSGPKTTNYTYDVDLAVEICGCTDPLTGANTPIVGVRRIWANGNLIYDASAGVSAATLLASGKVASNITVYLGTETQMPDPALEALTGVGTTPAYRGKAYVVFSALQLADFGNAIPNFTFEVVATGSTTPFRQIAASTLPHVWKTSAVAGIGRPVVYSIDDVVRVGSAGATYVYDLDGNYIGLESKTIRENLWPTPPNTYYPGSVGYIIGQLYDGSLVRCIDPLQTPIGGALPTIWINTAFGIRKGLDGPLEAGRQMMTCCMSADQRHILVLTSPNGTAGGAAANKWHLLEWDGKESALIRQGAIDPAAWLGPYSFGPGNCPQIHGSAAMLESGLGVLWSVSGNGGGVYTYAVPQADGGTLTRIYMGSYASINLGFPCYQSIFADNGVCVVVGGDKLSVFTHTPGLEPSPVALSSIVSTLCQRSGLQASDVDVTALNDTVHGYAISTQAGARAALEPLRQYAPFDATEAEGTLVFVPRGAPVAATIPWDDLAAHEGGERPDPLEITIADDSEVINGVTVVFPDPGASYQPSAQAARRNRVVLSGQSWQMAPAVNEQRAELPICMTPARGARIAEQLLWEAYTARKTAKFAVGIKYAALRPADVVIVVSPDATYRLRIARITESGLQRQVDCVFEDAALYTGAPASAPSAGVPAQSVAATGPTRMLLLDIPLLRDADDGPGFYLAAGRYLPGWPGATVFASADAGQTWDDVQTFANSAILGAAEDALPAWSGGNVFDEASRVIVRVSPGLQLASITADAVLSGGNAALLGNEIVQFRDAQLVGANLYRLSGLLRGRRGTEWATVSHTAGERFVLLAGVAGLARVVSTAADIGAPRSYKAVTSGDSLDSASAIEFTDTGVGLKPLAPVHINAGRDAAGNIVIQWVRRTRIDGEWRDYADAGLGEASERYEIEIYVGGASVASLSSMQPSISWPLSAQRAVAGGPVSSMLVRIYQRSAVVGRGYPGDATINLPPSVIMLPDAPTGDPSLPAGYLRKDSVAYYSAVAAAGATSIAMVVDSTVPPKIRYFGSADGGQTWAQIGADSSTAPVVSTVEEWNTVLADGTYIGFNNSIRNVYGAVPKIYRGTASTVPVYTGAELLGGSWPKCIASSGNDCYVITEAARVWKSTDKGSTWSDLGALSGDFNQLVTASSQVAARLRLHKAAAGWLLESISIYNDSYDGTATQKAILRTPDAEPVAGWITCLDLRSGLLFADYHGRLGKVGSMFVTRTEGNIAGGVRQSIFWVSSDSGQTWSSTVMSGQYYGGAYLSGLSGPYSLGTTPVYIEDGGSRYITYSSGSWSVQTASGRPAFASWRGVVSPSTGGLIIPAWTEQGYSMWRTANGTTWTVGTGINLD